MEGKKVPDTWERGDLYERYVGRWSRQVAPRFLSWLNITAGQRWLDVGCGTGALSGAILDSCAPAWVAGVEPSEGFLSAAKEYLARRGWLVRGTATEIPLAEASVDVVVSGLVLNFVADPRLALSEMRRVTVSGGTIGAYVWDYAGKMEFMRIFWDTATELDPDAARLNEGSRFPLCNPQALSNIFTEAGLAEIKVAAIDIPTVFVSFEEYWQPFLGGQGPAPAYTMSLEPAARARLRERLRERIPVEGDGTIHLTARAWAVRARVSK